MASESSASSGRGLELVRMDEPIVMTSSEVAEAILGERTFGRGRIARQIPLCIGGHSIDLILPEPDERACYPRPGCVAISEAILRAGLRLPIHHFFRMRRHLGVEMPFSVFQTLYIPKVIAGRDKTRGWYYLTSWGSLTPFVLDLSSSIKEWKSSWCWAVGRWDMMEGDPLAPLTVPTKYSSLSTLPRCELSSDNFEMIFVIYRLPSKKKSVHRLIRKNLHFVTHDLMASQDNFNKKMPLRPDFKTIQKMMAETRALKTSSSAYKKQMEDLVDANKRLPSPTKEEVPEDPEANLLRKGKKPAAPSK
ncbi:Hypothetical predicted protein [Olea europaea subsp. europaea]|uniref:Uncharacterized protein n=1 Tax=Olea europaea subsp. europaea TaxID=158383 RepID=A0A8S0TX15_OLEEU|nr:Hypothetical predicted protein [Olea europaea subsp. europaea]